MNLQTFNTAAEQAVAAQTKPLRLMEYHLPEGDVGSINIGWFKNGASTKLDPNTWLAQGYDGIRIIGKGADKTAIRCDSWDGITLAVGRHAGVVQLEGVHLYAGFDRACSFGEQNHAKILEPKFQFRFLNSKATVLPPTERGRTKWLLFGYNSDVYLQDVELDAYHASEHASYWHGFSKNGLLWDRVTVRASGAEQCKVRSDTTETAWAGNKTWVIVRDSSFRNWYQPWSARGGAAIVLQGAAANALIERSQFWGGNDLENIPGNQRSKCIMISSEGLSYDTVTGKENVGFGNGYVVVRLCALRGYSKVGWHNTILRAGRNGGSQASCRGLLIDNCGVWGPMMQVQTGEIPEGMMQIQNCNTPALRNISEAIGMDTMYEATYPASNRAIPLSEGIKR